MTIDGPAADATRHLSEQGPESFARRNILGVEVADATAAETLVVLDDLVAKRRRTAIAIANANLLNIAYRAPDLRAILSRFVVFNDGIGVDVAARLLHGARFRDNLNGTDFVPFFLVNSRHPLRIFLFGGKPEIVEPAAQAFGALSPKNVICGFHHGYVAPGDEAALVAAINEARPDVLLVALGNPLQERWIARHLDRLDCSLAIGVGALFDFMSGTVPRAPEWVRRLRSEWLYRLAHEPKRLANRYVVGNAVFLYRVGRQRLGR